MGSVFAVIVVAWYLKPASWYALKDPASEERLNDFPYANVILKLRQPSSIFEWVGFATRGTKTKR